MAEDGLPPEKKVYTRDEVEALLSKYKKKAKPGRVAKPKEPTPKELKIRASAEHRKQAQFHNHLVAVTLTMGHKRNDVAYGPGLVHVTNDLAQDLLSVEYHARKIEAQFRGEKAAIIGGRNRSTGAHQVIEVSPETFDEAYGTAQPFDRIRG